MSVYFIHARSGVPPFVTVNNLFSTDELDSIEYLAHMPGKIAETTSGLNTDVRMSETRWLEPSPENQWIFDRLATAVATINADHFHFNITAFESLQLATYKANGYFNWHQDVTYQTMSRKLSFTLQLTDPSKYDNGDLELFMEGPMSRERGAMVLFPSYQVHRVTKITSGVRHSLVAWILGPSFR